MGIVAQDPNALLPVDAAKEDMAVEVDAVAPTAPGGPIHDSYTNATEDLVTTNTIPMNIDESTQPATSMKPSQQETVSVEATSQPSGTGEAKARARIETKRKIKKARQGKCYAMS